MRGRLFTFPPSFPLYILQDSIHSIHIFSSQLDLASVAIWCELQRPGPCRTQGTYSVSTSNFSMSSSSDSSNSSSSSAGSTGSSATSPRPGLVESAAGPVGPVGPVNPSLPAVPQPASDVGAEGSCESSGTKRYWEERQMNPWLHITCKLKISASQVKKQFFIPPDYEVVIPRSFDRMHRPPRGFCAFSLGHFDAGLRLPLSLPVGLILGGLDICPMQLSPNSVRNILIFVIVMTYLELEPSFDNFWSLFSFTASKRSGERGFFYLTARPKCRFVDRLPSNVGTWKEQFLFIRPPPGQEWPFRCQWRESKPRPAPVEGGLEGDLISSLTRYSYKASVLLKEEVLKLAGLSPAPLRVRGTLGE